MRRMCWRSLGTSPGRCRCITPSLTGWSRHLFAAVSLPLRRKKTWPEECLVVTFGLGARLDSSRIAVAVEPYPNRWTHHVLVSREEEIDSELLGWLQEAYTFSECK